jgi:hypothetical protein
LPALAVNIIIVHPWDVVFPRGKQHPSGEQLWSMFTLTAGNNCILATFNINQKINQFWQLVCLKWYWSRDYVDVTIHNTEQDFLMFKYMINIIWYGSFRISGWYWCLGLIRDVIRKEPYNILYLASLIQSYDTFAEFGYPFKTL